MIRKIALICALFVASTVALKAENTPLEVTAPISDKLQLAIAPVTNLGGGERTDFTRDIPEILRFDLDLAGLFAILPQSSGGGTGIKPGDFDFRPWASAGAKLLIKAGYSYSANKVTVEFRLYDVIQEKQLAAKRYTGTAGDLRKITHTFSDEVLRAVTGEPGPFTAKIAFVSKRSGTKEIYMMDYDGHGVQRLTSNGSINLNPEFSPNGREIIYTSYKKKNPDLYRREIFSGSEARISSFPGINATATYATSGDKIALVLSKDGNSEIYVMGKDGRNVTRLTNNPAIDVAPAWSPDGSQIAFVSDRLGKPQVFIMNADGSGVRRLTTSGAYNVTPRWSPKGDKIAYARQAAGFQIYTINPDGTGDTQLTSEGSNEHPRWSPDGRFIAFSSTRSGGQGIYIMRADGTGEKRVSQEKGGDSHPVWSSRW